VFWKRLVRLVLAPGASAYVLLLAVLALIWLGAGRPVDRPTPPSLAQPVPTVVDREALPAGQGLIGLDEAIASARRFAGEPDLPLEGGFRDDTTGSRRVELYYLESTGQVRGEDLFKVDARTAEVIEATFRGRLVATEPPIGLSAGEAEQAATRYARDRFSGFDALKLLDRSSRSSENTVLHSFKWSLVAAESGAELPTSVSVAVSSGSGEVVWYLAQRDSVQVEVRPAVGREAAIRAAAVGAGERDSRWDTRAPVAVRLQVLYDEDDEQQLVWSVTFRGRSDVARPTLRLLVDAHSGQLIAGPS
jgi:hypothetical protein